MAGGSNPTVEPRLEAERLSPARWRRFTVAEYHRMIDVGILGEDEHVELLEGGIVYMSPQDKRHARAIGKLNRWFSGALSDEYVVRPQLPLSLPDSEPEPDLAIVSAKDEEAAERHPTSAFLIIEVADSSARHDLSIKARIYAQAAIPEYWLVVIPQQTIEVLRDPDAAAGVYRTRSITTPGSVVTPVALPGPSIDVRALFEG